MSGYNATPSIQNPSVWSYVRKANVAAILGVLALLSCPRLATAQDTARFEVFGGYSYMPLEAFPDFRGFCVSVTRNWNRRLGITADFSGHFATEKPSSFVGPPPPRSHSEVRGYFLLFGPQLSLFKRGRLQFFGHALVGLSHRSLRVVVSGAPSTLVDDDTGFSTALGGGLDIQVNGRLAIRAVRADYLFSRLGNLSHHDFRYAGGIVIRFNGS
jgi:hypothetical protein